MILLKAILLFTLPYLALASEASLNCEKQFTAAATAPDANQLLSDKILDRSNQAVETLLAPETPDSLVSEFEYGSNPDLDILHSLRATGLRSTKDPDALPSLDGFFEVSEAQPVRLSTSAVRGESRLSYFRGHFFSDGYYARKTFDPTSHTDSNWLKLVTDQPWLEWDQKNSKYVVRTKGATAKILSLVETGDKTELFRGTLPQEAQAMGLIKDVADPAKRHSAIQQLEQLAKPGSELHIAAARLVKNSSAAKDPQTTLLRALSSDLQSGGNLGFGGLFTTPSASKAALFAKGTVIKYSISHTDLQKLLMTKKLYAGVENSVEINFHGVEGLRVLMRSQVDVQTVKQDSNIFESQTSSIWK